MTGYLLDTNILIEYLAGAPPEEKPMIDAISGFVQYLHSYKDRAPWRKSHTPEVIFRPARCWIVPGASPSHIPLQKRLSRYGVLHPHLFLMW
jgi:hypothetical protein